MQLEAQPGPSAYAWEAQPAASGPYPSYGRAAPAHGGIDVGQRPPFGPFSGGMAAVPADGEGVPPLDLSCHLSSWTNPASLAVPLGHAPQPQLATGAVHSVHEAPQRLAAVPVGISAVPRGPLGPAAAAAGGAAGYPAAAVERGLSRGESRQHLHSTPGSSAVASTPGAQASAASASRSTAGQRPGMPRRTSPQPVSPRRRVSDFLPRQASTPQLQSSPRRPQPRTIPGSPAPFSTRPGSPTQSPRNFLTESNECLLWLKRCKSDFHAEDKVDELLEFEADTAGHMLKNRAIREHLRSPAYRDATKSATSLAKRAKPPQRWR